MALTKTTTAQVLYAIASTASNAISVGAALDVATYLGVSGKVRMGRATATGFTASPEIRIEATFLGTTTANDWVTVAAFVPQLGASIGSQAVSGTEAAGQTVVTLAAGTNFAANDFVFFHNTTIGNSEWKHVTSVSSADLTLQDALVNAQTGATCRDQAEEYFFSLDVSSIQELRVVVNGSTVTGQAVIVEASLGAVSALA